MRERSMHTGIIPIFKVLSKWVQSEHIYKGHNGRPPRVISSQQFDWSKANGFEKTRRLLRLQELCYWKEEMKEWMRSKGWDTTFHLPSEPGHKKRHYWFYGEFSWGGKTTVVEKKMNFKKKNVKYFKPRKALWRDKKDTTEH